MSEVRLQEWDPALTRARLDEVIAVYKEAFLDVHEADPVRAAAERFAYAQRHLERGGLRVMAALDDADNLVGVTYGLPGRRGHWWHDVVTDALGPDQADEWLADCFDLVELHVRPAYQGFGIGRRLLRALLADLPQRTVALSALEDGGSRARRLYDSEGFQALLSEFRFPGSRTRYAVLAKRLHGNGTATKADGETGGALLQ